MFIKPIALAAIVATAGSAATANSYFEFGETLKSSSVLDLGLVRSADNGVIEIYDNSRGAPGALLGTQSVKGGANSNVRVNVGVRPTQDVIALLKIDGEVVVEREYDINR
ncbi:hypothetical protein [Yoonia sp.]|uniref:hypothetical protein n=1 Tax=Yoonia sp. TaxID=2212373 RepID=UPI003F6CF07C